MQIIALSVQSQELASLRSKVSSAQYPILADAEHTVAELYGVFASSYANAKPSVFIIKQNGQIAWEYIGQYSESKVSSSTILENLPK